MHQERIKKLLFFLFYSSSVSHRLCVSFLCVCFFFFKAVLTNPYVLQQLVLNDFCFFFFLFFFSSFSVSDAVHTIFFFSLLLG